jgi:hypothetical protein
LGRFSAGDEGGTVARKTILVSDLSGKTIEDGKGAKIRITFEDGRRPSYELDVSADERVDLGKKGRQVARQAFILLVLRAGCPRSVRSRR